MAVQEIIDFMADLAEDERMQVCVEKSLLGGLLAGAGAATFSILFGPIGLLIGGTAGGGLGYLLSKGEFVSAVEIIRSMDPDRREKLAGRVRNIMQQVNAKTVVALGGLIAGATPVRQQLVRAMIDQFQDMNLKVRS